MEKILIAPAELPLPADDAQFGAVLIAEASASSLEAIHARLLPLAKAAGFTRLVLKHEFDGRDTYESAALGGIMPYTPLASTPWDNLTLEELETNTREKLQSLTESIYQYAHL
jgi:hypothetical protein